MLSLKRFINRHRCFIFNGLRMIANSAIHKASLSKEKNVGRFVQEVAMSK